MSGGHCVFCSLRTTARGDLYPLSDWHTRRERSREGSRRATKEGVLAELRRVPLGDHVDPDASPFDPVEGGDPLPELLGLAGVLSREDRLLDGRVAEVSCLLGHHPALGRWVCESAKLEGRGIPLTEYSGAERVRRCTGPEEDELPSLALGLSGQEALHRRTITCLWLKRGLVSVSHPQGDMRSARSLFYARRPNWGLLDTLTPR